MLKNMFYKHTNGMFLKLIKKRTSNVNTYIEVDELGVPIKEKRKWSCRPEFQYRIVTGFNNLTEIK